MSVRPTTVIGGAAGLAAVAGVDLARAQGNSGDQVNVSGGGDVTVNESSSAGGGASGGEVTLGDTISSRVGEAVAPIATNSGADDAPGGTSVDLAFDDSPGTAIADASGGNNNISFVS